MLSAATTVALNSVTVQTNTATVTPAANSSFAGYTPQQLQAAYGIPATITLNGQQELPGTGETIAIVDAYNDPNIARDLATFDAKYGLAPANLTVVNQNGSTSNLPANNASWAVEEALDVEWAHAVAPGATIVLVEANSGSLSDLLAAVNTASQMSNVVSMSWGSSEFPNETNYDKYFTTPGVTYVAAAGDSSAYFGPEWPASSPNVLAVGGTTLNLTSSNTIASETAWSASYSRYYGIEGGGGGISSYESTPAFQSQNGVSYGGRSTPDVAWDANPSTGVSVYDSYDEPGWGYVGGTSAGAPAWAGIVAIADQQYVADGGTGSLSTSQVENTLYQAYSGKVGTGYSTYFNDITSGNNGYQATTGYNLAAGLGSPKVGSLVSLLANPSSVSSSTTNSTITTTTGGTSTHGHHQRPVGNPADPRTVLGGSDAAGVSSTANTSSVVLSIMNPPTLVPPSLSVNSSIATLTNFSSLSLSTTASSLSATANASLFGNSVDASLPPDAILFGASGWKGGDLSSRLSSLGLPSQQAEPLADNLSEDEQRDLNDPSAADLIFPDTDDSGDLSFLDLTAAPVLDGDSGDGGEAGE